MKNKDLVEMLQQYDEDADVMIGCTECQVIGEAPQFTIIPAKEMQMLDDEGELYSGTAIVLFGSELMEE